ncbi:MAG: hypothetical protein LH624_18640, partial [Cryobacterium sp.]|nr:hypothetical protein [Cryobacterium sp.]
MSNPGEAETTYGRWPDDDRGKGRRRRDVQAAAARGLRRGRKQLDELAERADFLDRGGYGLAGRQPRGIRGKGQKGEGGERAVVPEATF